MVEDDCVNTTIPLPNVTGLILAKVIKYCKHHVEAPKSEDGASKSDKDLKAFDADFVKVVAKDEMTEEDQFKHSCTLFSPNFGGSSNSIRLTNAHLGKKIVFLEIS
ncbi:hypothetical protein AgCh_000249 [Apium graveolens]